MLIAGRCAKRPKDARKAPAACIARKRLKDRRQVLITNRSSRFVRDLTKRRRHVSHVSVWKTDAKCS